MDLDPNFEEKAVCDFGAGVGAFATLFEKTYRISPTCIELDANLVKLLKKKNLQSFTEFPAKSTFWDQSPSGSIWGANNGQLNLANSLGLLGKKDPDLSRVLYVPISVNLPPELSIKIASKYCSAGKAVTIPASLLPPVPKHSEMYINHLQYYVDPNLNITEINPS
jgi:hypothetical protein